MPEPERYTSRPFPPYRYLPGRGAHPTRDPAGHSYAQVPAAAVPIGDANRRTHEDFLYGVDLFNHRFWWEAHETFEALWHATGRTTPAGHCLQALIQCAAAQLQAELGHPRGARSLLRRAQRHAAAAGEARLGVDLPALLAQTARFLDEPAGTAAHIALER